MSSRRSALFHTVRLLAAALRLPSHTAFERLRFRLWRLEATVADMDDVPLHIRARRAVLVGAPRHQKWLVFDCPCGIGHRIILNLDRSRQPAWTLRVSKSGALTLHPSVNYRDDRRVCHYILSNGRIAWIRARHATFPGAGLRDV